MMIPIRAVSFLGSYTGEDTTSLPQKPAFAFVGRSNVGKSSLINLLLGRRNLARISSKPGKTQLINHFLVNETWCLADLPGYGWARVRKTQRMQWQKRLEHYLLHHTDLISTFLLVDARHPPQASDLNLMHWMGTHHVPFAVVWTKTDQCSKQLFNNHQKALKQRLLQEWEALPPCFVTSARAKAGREAVLRYIWDMLKQLGQAHTKP